MGYDDACHLKKFLQLRLKTSWFVLWLFNLSPGIMQVVCDFFHFPNHKSDWCKKNVDLSKCKVPNFGKSNTQCAEQSFAWLAGSKKQFRHMGEARFLFFMLRMAHLRNKQLCANGIVPRCEKESGEESGEESGAESGEDECVECE